MYNFIKEKKIVLIYIPLTIYWITLFVLTSIPKGVSINIGFNDKIKHFGAYLLLSMFMYLFLEVQTKFKKVKSRIFLITVFIISFYGVIDEIHQYFIPGRTCEFLDWIADLFGAVVGASIIRYFIKKVGNN